MGVGRGVGDRRRRRLTGRRRRLTGRRRRSQTGDEESDGDVAGERPAVGPPTSLPAPSPGLYQTRQPGDILRDVGVQIAAHVPGQRWHEGWWCGRSS